MQGEVGGVVAGPWGSLVGRGGAHGGTEHQKKNPETTGAGVKNP